MSGVRRSSSAPGVVLVLAGVAALAGCAASPVLAGGSADPSGLPPPATPATTTRGPSPEATSSRPEPGAPPPYVAGVRWVTLSRGRSLQVRPTAAGRTTDAPYPEAWREVLRLAPGADTPGMRAQFSCHWTFARLLSPHKASWDLEPWRPVVSSDEMLSAGCNPAGAQE
ncbi:MAG: DUF2599 domain-containing protein [Actinomycetota bacterium]|nr:DUF2599 domain-containing protein [Actinomycetota bacterium]